MRRLALSLVVLLGCGRDPLSGVLTDAGMMDLVSVSCQDNGDCPRGRCVYDFCSQIVGVCYPVRDGGLGCGGTGQPCCGPERCIVLHRCSVNVCVVC